MAILKKNSKNLYSQIVENTGVYQFLDKNKEPIYIGKANNLRERIKQHFTNRESPKEKLITKYTEYIKLYQTNSEFQALILEANQIRKYLPKYNAVLLDDKSRLYIVITKEKYPKVKLQRKNDLSSDNDYLYVFGPLTSVKFTRQFLRKIRQVIPFCMESKITKKPCFYCQIGLCDPCPNYIEQQETQDKAGLRRAYNKNIRKLIRLLSGSGALILKDYQKELKKHVEKLEFEQAAYLRDKIVYLEHLFSKRLFFDDKLSDSNYISELRIKQSDQLQKLLKLKKLNRVECYDVSNLSFKEATASMVVFEKGEPKPGQYRRFQIKDKAIFDPEMLLEVLSRRLKHKEWEYPDLIVIDGGGPQLLKIKSAVNKTKLPLIIGLAKSPDRIVLTKKPFLIELPYDSLALHYLQGLRDEAHRFAKKYHLYLRHLALAKLTSKVK